MTPEERKKIPMYEGLLVYFPLALQEVAKTSWAGNQQHHPDKPLHWDRSKSTDEADALMRHLTDYARGIELDEDGTPHLSKVAWRSLSLLEKYLEQKNRDNWRS